LFSVINDSISAKKSTLGCANVKTSFNKVALLIRVLDTISTEWKPSVWSASISFISILVSIIALFSAIKNTITNTRELTLQTAVVRLNIRVAWSVITLLVQKVLNNPVSISTNVILRKIKFELREEV